MSEYVRLSDAVNKAVTTCDIGLADDLRKELAPKRHDERYALLLKILDNVPDTPPEPQKQPVANLPDAPTPRQKPRQQADPPVKPKAQRTNNITLKDARVLLGIHKRYVIDHRTTVQSSIKVTKKNRKLSALRREYLNRLAAIGPTYMDAGEKIDRARGLLRVQTNGRINRDGSMAKSPQFQGGQMLRGGLPGSRR